MPAQSFESVAAETGYPVHEVISRGIGFCRKNPRAKCEDLDLDQTLPATFDRDVAAALDASARDHVAEAKILSYDPDAIARRLAAAQKAAALVSASGDEVFPIFLHRQPAEGGVSLVGRIGEEEVFASAAVADDEAARAEPIYREALLRLAALRVCLAA